SSAIPDPRMRALERFRAYEIVIELEKTPFEVQHLFGAGFHKDGKRFVIHSLRRRHIRAHTIAVMLEQCASLTDAKLQASTAEMIEQADLLIQAQRVMQREYVDQRAESNALGALSYCSEEHTRTGDRAERRRVVFGNVINVISLCFKQPDKLQAILELLPEG